MIKYSIPNINYLVTVVAIVFASLLPVGFSGQTESQTRNISGRVFDENGKPFPYVSVISSADSVRLKPLTGNLSGADGSFVLKIPMKEYLFISFSFLGYETKTIKLTNSMTDVGDIYMNLKPTELSEVVVRPIIEIYPDEIIYNITSDPERKTSNMLDIFSKIPGILTGGLTEDISLADNRKFIVLRNGRRDALFTFKHMKFRDVINKLPAMGFTQIKILFNPPLKYAKEFDVVIDVITDKSQRLYGAAASPYTTYEISFNKIETASGFVSSFDKIRISGSIGYSSEKSPLYYYKKINYLNEDRQNEINSTTVSGKNPLKAELNTSLDISKNQFINLSFNASWQKSFSNSSSDIHNSVGGITTDSFYESERRRVSPDLSTTLTYNYDFGKQKNKTFIASYLYTISPWREEYNHRNKDENGDNTNTEQDISESIDYNHKLDLFFNHNSKNLRFNLNGGFLNKGYNTVTYENQTLSSETTIKHTIADLSSNINYALNNKMTLSGTCYLNYQINDERSEIVNGDESVLLTKNPFSYSGSVNLSYLLNKKNIKSFTIGYNLSQNRPAFAQLSNYRSKSDPYGVSTGNYNLKPENLNTLLLSFKFKNGTNYILSYIFSNNKIETIYRNENGVMTKSLENSGSFKSLKISTVLAYFKQGKYRANGNISAGFSDTKSRTNLSKKRIAFTVTGSTSYFISKTFGIHCSVLVDKYFDWGYYCNSRNMPINANLGIIYGKMKGKSPVWTFETSVNIFNFGRSKYTSNIKETNFEYFEENTSQFRIPVGLKFRFHIGHFEVSPRTTNQKASVRGYSM